MHFCLSRNQRQESFFRRARNDNFRVFPYERRGVSVGLVFNEWGWQGRQELPFRSPFEYPWEVLGKDKIV